ncbi:MAG: serine--tRNA ligase, partial [Candidatus Poseidoniaceae archaeon]|nr:serine--tRNA ligase [Candidatus Poseidoniaceae archaeon]
VADLGSQITALEKKTDDAVAQRDSIRMSIPNILHEDVPKGADESGNTVHSVHGSKPEFEFEPRTHNELIEMNKWVDLKRAAKIVGSRFFFLKGDLARLEFALQQYAVDFIRERGYTFVQPPVMMNKEAYEGVTDLSDFETVMYGIEPDKYYMIATSEHPLTAMFMGETIPESDLPLRIVGVSPCFRREVGSHGQSDLGIWRVHQFTKIEQIIISSPEQSWDLQEELLQNCIDLWDALGMHYEVVNICTGDMGTVAARKYDLEAWIPGADQYKEIVSCSNCTDYQANRLQIRYGQPGHSGQPIAHTLNSTAVATSRALVAIMEQNQLEDGRVRIPEVLQPLMGGQQVLEPCTWG